MDREDARSFADAYGPAAGLAVVIGFMTWVRTLGADDVFVGGNVYFTSGNDPWYHARIVHLVVNHFPATQRFDAWSYFPYGTGRHSGFGGLFDQLIALAAMIVGAGSPSPHTVNTVIAYAPVAFGALTAIPAYLIAKWATNRWGGLLAAAILALLGGQFLSRTVVGVADHQSSEAFFGTLAFAGFIYAVRTGYAEKPTVADLRDRNWVVLRRPAVASLLGGTAIASYLMTWGPGVAFVFTMGVFVLLQMVRDYLNGRPTEYLAITTAATMLPAGVLTLAYAKEYGLSATGFSLLQPLVVTGIGAGAVLMYGIATYVSREGYERRYYPAAVGGVIVAVLVVSFLVYPKTLDLFESLFVRMYSYGTATSRTAGTVGEIQPASLSNAWQAFGPTFYLAVFGFLVLLARVLGRDKPIELLLVLWSFSAVSAYFTMLRFGYYLAVNVALLSGFAIWWTASGALELGEIEALRDVETYQIIGVALLLVLVVPGNVVAMDTARPTWERAEFLSGSNQAWHGELAWMNNNTPAPPLDYDERLERPEDGDFEYPDGAYGVMSWWDYGHWITYTAERIPHANPFQEGPQTASAYLLAQSEERANLLIEALPSMEGAPRDFVEKSNAELRAMIDNQSEQEASEDVRYVVIDDQMAAIQGISRRSSGKFNPITQWTDPDGRYVSLRNRTVRTGGGNTTQAVLPGVSARYERTMLSRLYFEDGTTVRDGRERLAPALEHYRLVHETNASTTFLSVGQRTTTGEYRGLRDAIGLNVVNAILTPGLQGFIQRNALVPYDIRQESRVKTFERVEGARLTGQVNASRLNGTNATAAVTVPLQTNAGRNFTYRAQAPVGENGSFSVTVPYATDNAVGPADGGTDSGVTARGNYSVRVARQFIPFRGGQFPVGQLASGSAEVPESAVYDGSEVALDLDPTVRYQPGSLNATLGDDRIANGSTTGLTVTAAFTNGTTRTVTRAATLTSNDTSVATIDANGTVTANGTGVARLNVSYEGETVSAVLTVENATNSSTGSLRLRPGDEFGADATAPGPSAVAPRDAELPRRARTGP